jgi:hypothetical protein
MAEDQTPPLPPVLSVILLNDWYQCQPTVAELVFRGHRTSMPVPLDDPNGLIKWDLASAQDASGQWFILAGFSCLVQRSHDSLDGSYQLMHAGEPCREGSEEEGSEGSEEEGSGPEGSGVCFPVTGQELDYPVVTNPAFLKGVDANGCHVYVASESCPTGVGSDSGGGMGEAAPPRHGWSGSYPAADGKMVTVVDGIITGVA